MMLSLLKQVMLAALTCPSAACCTAVTELRVHDSVDGVHRGDGYQFDHQAFTGSHGRNDKAQHFLSLFRHSQLYEVFINERLKLASQDYKTTDTFECKVPCSFPACSVPCIPGFINSVASARP